MLTLPESFTVYLDTEFVDMRKSINGLSARVIDEFELSPQGEAIFIFWNKSRDKMKLLFWDRNGFVLYYKRLERGKFKIPKQLKGDKVTLTADQLSWLLAGLDFHLMQEFSHLNYSHYY